MHGIKRIYSIIFIFLLLFVFFSCSKKEEVSNIPLPPTPIAPLGSQWGVVTSHFLRIRENPGRKARILAHIRKGTIVEIITKTTKQEVIEKVKAYWYQIDYRGLRGWVFGGYLKEFESKTEALNFAKNLK